MPVSPDPESSSESSVSPSSPAPRLPNRRLWLIGYRGAGKSTVGRRVADLARLPFFDADVELERTAGRRIADIFRDDGESTFRDLEASVLADLAERGSAVIATGGGVILRPANRETLRRTGLAVWLDAPTDELKRRLAPTSQTQLRPSLTGVGTLEEIVAVLEQRIPLYRETAHAVVDASASPDLVAERVLRLWRGAEGIDPLADSGIGKDASS